MELISNQFVFSSGSCSGVWIQIGMKGTPGQEETLTQTWNWGETTAEFIPLCAMQSKSSCSELQQYPEKKADSDLSFQGASTISMLLSITGSYNLSHLNLSSTQAMW